jgi:hypothetical protein
MAAFGSKNMASALNSTDNLAISQSLWFDIKVATILLLHPCILLMHTCAMGNQRVNRTFITGQLKVPFAIDFLSVMSQSWVSLLPAFIAPATCVTAASKFPAFVFISFVVFCSRKRDPSSGVQR